MALITARLGQREADWRLEVPEVMMWQKGLLNFEVTEKKREGKAGSVGDFLELFL